MMQPTLFSGDQRLAYDDAINLTMDSVFGDGSVQPLLV